VGKQEDSLEQASQRADLQLKVFTDVQIAPKGDVGLPVPFSPTKKQTALASLRA
jgi:hypothetical protein